MDNNERLDAMLILTINLMKLAIVLRNPKSEFVDKIEIIEKNYLKYGNLNKLKENMDNFMLELKKEIKKLRG